ncbi:MAG: hypothetical protein KDC46_15345 [Thermoleophilia bacterium]|nr:hypothetical protein [Thermoleophilia bacterium]
MTSAGRTIQESLGQDRAWMSSCTTIGARCDAIVEAIDPDDLTLADVDGAATIDPAETWAVPIDSEVDGVGNADKDGVIPDYYKLSIRILPTADVAARYLTTPEKAARTFVTSIDRAGHVQVGSLTVQGCKVLNQIDERMTLQGCRASGRTDIRMSGCPPQPMSPASACTDAFSWVSGRSASTSDRSPFVSMKRVTLPTFQVVSSDGVSYPSASAKHVDGEYVFRNLPAGTYNIRGLPNSSGSGTERWTTKEIPAYHGSSSNPATGTTVSVEPGTMSRALVVFRPKATGHGIDLQFERKIWHYYVTTSHSHKETVFIRKPTKRYFGINAEQYCADMAALDAQINGRGGLDFDVIACNIANGPGNNCVTITFTSQFREAGTLYDPTTSVRSTCTYFSQWLTNRYYRKDRSSSEYVDGPPKSADWEMRPAPDARAARPVAESSSTIDPRIEMCLVKGHAYGSSPYSGMRRCVPSTRIDNLDPGLHTRLIDTDNDSATDHDIGIYDLTNGGSGSWVYGKGVWVKPNGTIVTPTGTKGIDPAILMRANGECYWHAPIWWSSRVESRSCGSCNTVYRNKVSYGGACAVMDRSCLSRRVWEEGDLGTTELSGYATGAPDCRSFTSKPWLCSSSPATLIDGNCKPWTPPPVVPPKIYAGSRGSAETGGGNWNSNSFDA